VARLEEHREFPHALLSGLRVTFQPAAPIKFGYTNASQAFGSGSVSPSTQEYLEKIFVPTLDTTGRTVNGLVAYPYNATFLALGLSALTMGAICLVIAPLGPSHDGEALLNRISM
jgi:hypothetical protein